MLYRWSVRFDGYACYLTLPACLVCPEPPGSVAMAGAAGKENAAKRSRTAEGQQGLPERCDRDRHRNTIKYQARVSYKPDGSKTVQRNAGTFDNPEEATRATDSCLRGEACRRHGRWTPGMERRFALSTSEARCGPALSCSVAPTSMCASSRAPHFCRHRQ